MNKIQEMIMQTELESFLKKLGEVECDISDCKGCVFGKQIPVWTGTEKPCVMLSYINRSWNKIKEKQDGEDKANDALHADQK